MVKWSDGHPRKTIKNKIINGKLPYDCPGCKRAKWFEPLDGGKWSCPKCKTILEFD